MGYKRLQVVRGRYKWLQGVTRVRMGCIEVQGVTKGYKVLLGVTGGYNW